jgi:excisionase family DNA binding protein
MPSELLTTQQAANRLGITSTTLIAWVKQGRLPASRPGRGFRIAAGDVDSLLAGRMVQSREVMQA